MAYRSLRVSIANTPTLLIQGQPEDLEAWVRAEGNDPWLGDSNVSSSTGFFLSGSEQLFHTEIRPGDELYGVKTGAGSAVAEILVRSA